MSRSRDTGFNPTASKSLTPKSPHPKPTTTTVEASQSIDDFNILIGLLTATGLILLYTIDLHRKAKISGKSLWSYRSSINLIACIRIRMYSKGPRRPELTTDARC
jgi:hypothetical protein